MHALQEPPRPRDPAGCLGGPPVDPLLAPEVDGEPGGRQRVAAPPVGRVGLAAPVDSRVALAQPPQRLPEPVQRLGILRLVFQRRGERVARPRPVSPGEGLPAGC
jgi:hypothetical protein